MVAVANIASLLAALLVAGSLAAPPNVHAPPPDGVAPRAGAPPVEGGSCDIATDRVACANATSIVMCRHNKWVALSSCGSGRVCSKGICAFPAQTSSASATAPAATSAALPAGAPIAAISSASAPAASRVTPSAASTQGAVGASPVRASAQSAGGAAPSAASAQGAGGGAAPTDNAASGDSSGGSPPASGGSHFGITCSKFNQAVSKASAAIGQSYPRPSNAQCSAFLSGLPKGRISSGREAAMFLANILWESDGLRAKEEYDCKANPDWCAQNYKLPDDSPGKAYWGRGYIQLTWGYNYKAASRALFGSDVLVNNPSLVANNENVAWDVSYWYWSENVHSDPGVQAGKFGASVNKINGALECRGAAQAKAKKRYEMYKVILPIFAPGQAPIEGGCYN